MFPLARPPVCRRALAELFQNLPLPLPLPNVGGGHYRSQDRAETLQCKQPLIYKQAAFTGP
jgi:hypothetical protein